MTAGARPLACVTGAGRGIGRAVAARLADDHAIVVIDIDGEVADRTAAELTGKGAQCHAVQIDVADEDSVTRGFREIKERLGPADVLVNCAGVWAGGSITEVSVADWDRTVAVNLRGVFLCSRAVLPAMMERGRGSIVNVASIAGLKETRRTGAYNPSKAAVIALTKNIALDYATYKIRANAVCPGLIGGTAMERQVRDFRGDTLEYQQAALATHPLGRLGTPEDVAEVVAFLSDDRSAWTTGAVMVVDGGALTGVERW